LDVLEKLRDGSFSIEDGVKLYEMDLHRLGEIANQIRKEKHGLKTYFNVNRHINPTNICKDVCKFCAFSANRKNPNPYTMEIEEIVNIAKQAYQNGANEIHIVSAHNPNASLDWYLGMFKAIKQEIPDIHIKALTAAEIHFLCQTYNLQYEQLLDMMIENGVDSMPGGGAEIFDEAIRSHICKGKVDSKNWLKIHQIWHQKGKKSNATMLFGHIEQRSHRIDHMLRLRKLQEQTHGFNAFIPLVYQRHNNYLKVTDFLTGVEILKTFAIARIILDNIANLKAYWVTSTINLALVAQEYGANDLDGTIQKESINAAAGAQSAGGMGLDEFVHLIKDSGFIPVQRDSLYNEIKAYN